MVELEEIIHLMNLKQEGGYWDFKRQWYNDKQKNNLLHDIICMANNLENRDAYIIIGVDEENDYCVQDISNDVNRKNTQKIVDFLKDKKFAGDIRPTVYIKDFKIIDKNIDVIVIKNDDKTPYYLKERFETVEENNIYTRIQDTNTPINKSADVDKVEWLWKKRFGLIYSPLERLELYLEDYQNWIDGPYGEMQKYYKLFPEFTIEYKSASDERDGYEYYLFSQVDSRPHWYDIKLRYHQTLLKEIGGVSLDGGRYFTPCPDIDGITLEDYSLDWNFSFRYFTKNSFNFKMNNFFFLQEKFSDKFARDKLFKVVLLFENDIERLEFKGFVRENWDKRESYLRRINLPNIAKLPQYRDNAFVEEYENALILNMMLIEFRGINY